MQGDSTLYTRGDAVEAAWRFLDPVLEAWKKERAFCVGKIIEREEQIEERRA
jgi:glucose-6-phosphate 1-dehydrogenase